MIRNRVILTGFLFFAMYTGINAQSLEETYLINARNYFAINDYPKAYDYINFVLKLQGPDELTDTSITLAENIYFDYIGDLVSNRKLEILDQVKLNLLHYPAIRSERIDQLLKQTEEQIALEKQRQIEEEQRRQRIEEEREKAAEQAKWRLLELEEEKAQAQEQARLKSLEIENQHKLNEQMLEMKRLELEELARREALRQQELKQEAQAEASTKEERDQFNRTLLALIAQSSQKEDRSLSPAAIAGIITGGVLFLIVLVILVIVFMRNSQQQQQFFEYTLHQNQPVREVISIPMFTAPASDKAHMIEHRQERMLPPPVDRDMEGIKVLLEDCRNYAFKIDAITDRKNTIMNVAELVFKVSKYMGYNDYEAMVFLAAALVYDIGFLALDPSLFQTNNLTEEQYGIIKTHPKRGLEMIDFVNPEYKQIFREGILKHHEALDGSGYPSGLTGEDIPFIARLIHAAESYEAMTSYREFKEIMTKTEAMNILFKQTEIYDIEILKAIDNVT